MFGIVILVCITGFFGYASITLLSRNEPAWFILTVFFSIFCYITYNAIKKFQERKKRESETQYIDDKYLSIKNSLDIPNTCKEVTYFSSTIDSKLNFGERRVDLLCWKVDGDLCFFPSSPSDKNQVKIDEMNVISIPISEIEYFSRMGEMLELHYFNNKGSCSIHFNSHDNNSFKEIIPEKEKKIIPENAKEIIYLQKSKKAISFGHRMSKYLIWKTNEDIYFFPSDLKNTKIMLQSIPLQNIEYFSKRGEIYRENKISGGGGGGSSVGGAVVGALIAGDTGAIIGSRKKVEEIKSELITHDTRETFLNYFNENNERCSIFLILIVTIFSIIYYPKKNFPLLMPLNHHS